jgi:hypothetical protein
MIGTFAWTPVSDIIIAGKKARALMDVISVEGGDL